MHSKLALTKSADKPHLLVQGLQSAVQSLILKHKEATIVQQKPEVNLYYERQTSHIHTHMGKMGGNCKTKKSNHFRLVQNVSREILRAVFNMMPSVTPLF